MDAFLMQANDREALDRARILPESSYVDSVGATVRLPEESALQWKRRCYAIQQRDPCAFWNNVVTLPDRRGRHARQAVDAVFSDLSAQEQAATQ